MKPQTWLLLLVAGFIIWLAARARLAAAVAAIEGKAGSSGGLGLGLPSLPGLGINIPGTGINIPLSASGSGGGANAAPPAGFLAPGLFGLSGVTGYAYGETYSPPAGSTPIAALDQLGLTFAHLGQFAHDYDFALAAGSKVDLPPGGPYTLIADYTDANGTNIEAFRPQTGTGGFEFVDIAGHLPSSDLGQVFAGGTPVATSGEPANAAAGFGQHLAVITDLPGDSFLRSLFGMAA